MNYRVYLAVGFLLALRADDGVSTQGWIYPGNPACSASQDIADGRVINVLKPQYLSINAKGVVTQTTVANSGCNGYSTANVALVKKYSQEQYITVSADGAALAALVSTPAKQQNGINAIIAFVKQIGVTGVELDFEEYSSWSATTYAGYKLFLTNLGNALHALGKKLMVCTPAIPNADLQKAYNLFKYEDFNLLPIDYITVMCYDAMWDYGAGTPVTPSWWLVDSINWVKARICDVNRIVIGLPSYGYHGTTGQYTIAIDTYEQTQKYPGFATAQRDPESQEMFWQNNGISYFYQDTVSLDYKRSLAAAAGVKAVSVWHLGGGNKWFSK